MSLSDIGDLIPEEVVYETYGHILTKGELLAARKAGVLGHYQLGRTIAYTMAQLVAYFETKRQDATCQSKPPQESARLESGRTPESSSKTSGSEKSQGASTISAIGMTPARLREVQESAVKRSERTT